MDRQSVFTSRVFDTPADSEDSNTHVRGLLESFILDFRLDNIYIYRSASSKDSDYELSGDTDTIPVSETKYVKMRCSKNTTAT